MKQIEEGDESSFLESSFFGYTDDPVIPNNITWSAYCVTTETVLQSSTNITPDYTIQVQLNGNLVTLQDPSNKKELKRVCINAIDSVGNILPQHFEYEVIPSNNCR